MSETPRLIYCRCTYARVLPAEIKDEVLDRLCDSGVVFDSVPDLCEMSARKDPALKQYAECGNLRIAACYPRAVKWLFDAAGAPLQPEGVNICNMRVESAESVVSSMLEMAGLQQEGNK